MDNPATTIDVATRWRPLTQAETPVAWTLLDDAWSILQVRLPTIDARLTADTVDANLVRMTLANMVIRVLRNIDGKTSESIEDYSYTVNQLVAAGYLFVSADELNMLDPVGVSGSAFTIRPYGTPDTSVSSVWDVVP